MRHLQSAVGSRKKRATSASPVEDVDEADDVKGDAEEKSQSREWKAVFAKAAERDLDFDDLTVNQN